METNSRIRYQPLTLALLALLLGLTWQAQRVLEVYAFDDAFIHLRIVRNWLQTGTPNYNLGENILGSSAPIWLIFLHAFGGLFKYTALEHIAAYANLVLLFMASLIWGHVFLGQETKPSATSVGLAFLISFCALLPVSCGLMETPLALLLLGTGFCLSSENYIAKNSRPKLCGALAWVMFGLAAQTRLELAVFPLLLIFFKYLSARNPGAAFQQLLLTLLGAAPGLFFSYYFFGALWPHTLSAKTIVYTPTLAESGRLLLPSVLKFDPVRPLSFSAWTFIILTAILAAASLKTNLKRLKDPLLPTLILGAAAIAAAYLVFGVLVFPWYEPLIWVPLIGGFFLLGGGKVNLLFVLLLAPQIIGASETLLGGVWAPSLYPYFESNARVRSLRSIGRMLEQQYPKANLLAAEIGGLGYEFNGHILDGMGLVTPQALMYHPVTKRSTGLMGVIPPKFVADSNADIIVSLSSFLTHLDPLTTSKYIEHDFPIYLPEDSALGAPKYLWGSDRIRVLYNRTLEPEISDDK